MKCEPDWFAMIIHLSVLITVLGADVLHVFFYLLVGLAIRWRALYNLVRPLSVHTPGAGTPLLQMSSAAPPIIRNGDLSWRAETTLSINLQTAWVLICEGVTYSSVLVCVNAVQHVLWLSFLLFLMNGMRSTAPVYLNLMTTQPVGSLSAYDWHAGGRDMFLVNRREMPNRLVIITTLTSHWG